MALEDAARVFARAHALRYMWVAGGVVWWWHGHVASSRVIWSCCFKSAFSEYFMLVVGIGCALFGGTPVAVAISRAMA
jgi:hypothetical protein